MTFLCDLCTKLRKEYHIEFCRDGLPVKRYHEQCNGFTPSHKFKPYVDEITSFLGITGEAMEKLLALKDLHEMYLSRDEIIALELTAHFVDKKGGWNANIDELHESLESAHDKLLKNLEENGKES